ncbi:MAG: L,D-transpeptidase family protein [Desulforegulaceae bacterium]|nr:L,D-transpeptidase family protein [Desulforegulaceae bacterium]
MFFINKSFFIRVFLFVFLMPFNSYSGQNRLFPLDVVYSDVEELKIILVDKESQKLFLIENKKGVFESKMELKCSTGKNKGDKLLEGDSKTPEGVYTITGHFTKRHLSPVYGTRALTLDYPNYLDKAKGKNGYNIWIHGTDKEPLEERTTNGCVALANGDIDILSDYVEVDKTPVVIAEKTEFMGEESDYLKRKENFKVFFDSWIESAGEGSYHDYLRFYSKDYLPDLSWWEDWQKLKKAFKSISIKKKNLNIFRENDGLYTFWFDFFIEAEEVKSNILKRKLFVKSEKEGLKIIGDVYFEDSEDIVTAGRKIKDKVLYEKDIEELVGVWARAWSDKDIIAYGNCYSSDFYSEGMNKKKWLKYKDRLNKKYDYIKVEASNIQIEKKGRTVKAVFFQTYESSGFSTKGIKILMLKKEEGQWKIFKEIWKGNG